MQQLLNDEYFIFAIELADTAANISNQHFRNSFEISTKKCNSLVTAVDLEIEEKVRALIKKNYPEHGVIGEEFANSGIDKEYVWVIDPIDGTVAYATGKPTYSTLVALLKDGEPVIGIIDQAILKERFIGVKEFGAWLNGQQLKTSGCKDITMARLNATTPYMFTTDYEKKAFNKIHNLARVTSFGGDSYAYGLLAAGHIDIIMEADLKYYDVASVIPIIEESGGVITNWQGEHICHGNFDGQCLVTASAELHQLVLKTIQSIK